MRSRNLSKVRAYLLGTILSLLPGTACLATQATYATEDEALGALTAAMGEQGLVELRTVLGPKVDELGSGDPVADRLAMEDFLKALGEGKDWESEGDGRRILLVGADSYPFPIPLVRDGDGWRFDTDEGAEELINRRIGRNELHVLASLRAYVEAQYEYSTLHSDQPRYARKLRSSAGKRDGLYWETAEGEAESPMGPLVAQARREGYRVEGKRELSSPYHGYLFKILKGQGTAAPGGAHSYLDEAGLMTRGFAMLASPASYGDSGIMSFQVNHRGIIFQTDLGPDTEALSTEIGLFNPDSSWDPAAAE